MILWKDKTMLSIRKIISKFNIRVYRMTTMWLSKGQNVSRYYMYNHLSMYAKQWPIDAKVLSISNSEKIANILGFADNQIVDVSYPEYNILGLPFKDGEFDAVVTDQVLEHVEGNPQSAIDETFRILKPNGFALHTTCFINPLHAAPSDFWRFSSDALKLLVAKHGEIIDAGGWGNPLVWPFSFLGLRYQKIPHAHWHPAHWIATFNHVKWPIVTWVLARKYINRLDKA